MIHSPVVLSLVRTLTVFKHILSYCLSLECIQTVFPVERRSSTISTLPPSGWSSMGTHTLRFFSPASAFIAMTFCLRPWLQRGQACLSWPLTEQTTNLHTGQVKNRASRGMRHRSS